MGCTAAQCRLGETMDRQTAKAFGRAMNELSHAPGPLDAESMKKLNAEVARLGKKKPSAKTPPK